MPRPIQIGLKHYEDFLIAIPREEVARIGQIVVEAGHTVLRGLGIEGELSYEICGGYRRGKEKSGDVDIVLTHETCHTYDNMLTPLLKEMERKHVITTVISSHRNQHAMICSLSLKLVDERDITKQSNSGISIALVVIVLPGSSCKLHRRLDIIIAPPRSYITAITGWSGSTTLERDLRRYTNDVMGWTFDSTGISDVVDRRPIEDESFIWSPNADVLQLEKNLFAFLGLEWIPPNFRNAG